MPCRVRVVVGSTLTCLVATGAKECRDSCMFWIVHLYLSLMFFSLVFERLLGFPQRHATHERGNALPTACRRLSDFLLVCLVHPENQQLTLGCHTIVFT